MEGAVIASGVLCTFFAFPILLADSFFLLTPHSVAAKLRDASAMRRVYGPVTGVGPGYMDKFDGLFALCQLLPIVVCVWLPDDEAAATIAILCLACAPNFLFTVGNYMSFGNLFPGKGPLLFVVIGSVFSANLVWRGMDAQFGVPAKVVPVVVAWHAVCLLIAALYSRRILVRTPQMKHTIKLWHLTEEPLKAGATWLRGKDLPEEFVPPTNVQAGSARELEAAVYTPPALLAASLLALVGAVCGAAVGVINSSWEPPAGVRDYMYITLGLVVIAELAQTYIVLSAASGGFGRKELDDYIENKDPSLTAQELVNST